MNKFFTFTIIAIAYLTTSHGICSQDITPPLIQFYGLKENWYYIPKDSNFIKSPEDKWSTPYWGLNPKDAKAYQDKVFLLEQNIAQSPYGILHGSLLHALDINTGKPKWIHHNNTFAGLYHREDYSRSEVFINDDENIELYGYKAIDTLNKAKFEFGFYANPIKKTLDINNGEVLDIIEGKDTSKLSFKAVGLGGHKIFKNTKNQLFSAAAIPYYSSVKSGVSFIVNKINKEMEFDTNRVITYADTYINSDDIKADVIIDFRQLGRDTILLFQKTYNFLPAIDSLLDAKLVWLDISDVDSIRVVQEKNIFNAYHNPQDGNFGAGLQVIDENIFIFQLMIPKESPVDARWFSWLLWMDKDGNEQAHVPFIYNQERNYNFVYTIAVKDEQLFLTVTSFTDTEYGMDILKVEKNSNIAVPVGQIVTPKSDLYQMGVLNMFAPLKDDNFLIGFAIDYNLSNGLKTQVQYYYSFKMTELGLISSTTHVEKPKIAAYPNPANVHLIIDVGKELLDTGLVQFYDLSGKKVFTHTGFLNGKAEIDISTLPGGIYVYDIISKAKSIGTGKFIKK
ncbi:MAG: T9SS type A sorting domain-containing protein [Saprospiraceae bacterium]